MINLGFRKITFAVPVIRKNTKPSFENENLIRPKPNLRKKASFF